MKFIKEFNRDAQRYINLVLKSDKRIQILTIMFIADNIIGPITELLKQFPSEVMLDLKAVNKSKDKEYIDEFIAKYSLNEADYSLDAGGLFTVKGEVLIGKYFERGVQTHIYLNPNETIKQFVENNSVANIRQRRLEELGL